MKTKLLGKWKIWIELEKEKNNTLVLLGTEVAIMLLCS